MLFSGLVQDLNHSSVVNKLTLSDVLKGKDEIFAQDLGTLKGTKARIHVDANAQPKFCKARSVAYTLQEKVDKETDYNKKVLLNLINSQNGLLQLYRC